MLTLPYHHLNLRINPFGELTLDERSKLVIADVTTYIHVINNQSGVLQFLGQKGRGKTSNLLALRQHFPDAPYIHFAEGAPTPRVPDAPLVFLDETQRLTQRRRQALWKRGATFIIATHESHQREFDRAGIRSHTVYLSGLSVKHIHNIVNARLRFARRASGVIPTISEHTVARLIDHYGDDVRAIEDCLYNVIESMSRQGNICWEA